MSKHGNLLLTIGGVNSGNWVQKAIREVASNDC